jgi:hypothetical protein
MKKTEYKDLSTWLKILVVYGLISLGWNILWFLIGFISEALLYI